jgi:2-dehydropantoate 2-reductase
MTQNATSSLGRVAIIGSGAVGCYYGGRLAQRGQDVHFLMRNDLQHVQQHGLNVCSVAGDFQLPSVQAYASSAEIGPCDLVIITLKATSNALLPSLIQPLLHEGTRLLTLQNGLGSEELLAEAFPQQDILGGVCFVCIHRSAPGCIHHTAQGRISLGSHRCADSGFVDELASAMRAAEIETMVEPNLMAARWKKLVWNIPFNGLSIAAGQLDTAQILADPALTARVHALMQEVIATATALGYPMPAGLADDMIRRTRTMAGYRPSSLIDFAAGREVELAAIWSTPLQHARTASLPMPELEKLHAELERCCCSGHA